MTDADPTVEQQQPFANFQYEIYGRGGGGGGGGAA
jgi:hypothetical protein